MNEKINKTIELPLIYKNKIYNNNKNNNKNTNNQIKLPFIKNNDIYKNKWWNNKSSTKKNYFVNLLIDLESKFKYKKISFLVIEKYYDFLLNGKNIIMYIIVLLIIMNIMLLLYKEHLEEVINIENIN